MAGDAAERDLSWLDGTITPVFSPDGTRIVFQEWGDGGGLESSTYYQRMDGSTPVRLDEGVPWDVSPDWTTVLVAVGLGVNSELKLVPIGAGETRTLPRGPVHSYQWGWWHPDGKRIVILGSDAEGQKRFFVQDVPGGLPHPFARLERLGNEDVWLPLFSPDGHFIGARPKGGVPVTFFPIDGGEVRQIPFLRADESPIIFSDDSKSLFVTGAFTSPFPRRILKLDLATGRRELWLELAPPDQAGVIDHDAFAVCLTPNGRSYAYWYKRLLSELWLVEGLR